MIKFFLALSLLILLSSTAIALPTDKNKVLFEAMSQYEDLTEYALNQDMESVEKIIIFLDSLIKKEKNILSEKAIQNLNANFKKIKMAKSNADFPIITMSAVDSYKTIAEELEYSKLKIPKGVVLLDYIGFKIEALLEQNRIDWTAINKVALEGSDHWTIIKRNISDKGLKDAMNTAIGGIIASVKLRNIEMLKFSAQVNLDLVDLLEGYYEKK
jgi:hypothetical protein